MLGLAKGLTLNTFFLFAAVCAGFAGGVTVTLLCGAVFAVVALFGWWRFCQSVERAGLDIRIVQPSEIAKDPE